MEYFIFDYKEHIHLINSFLESAATAHNQPIKSKEWFFWKFKNNPFGKSVIACLEDNGKIVGCVAYGIQNFINKAQHIKGAISFETFVHPDYQGLGVFSKLLLIAEEEIKSREVAFLLNFPNSNSLKGFLNKGWEKLDGTEYWIKGKNIFKILFNINQIKKPFTSAESNFNDLIIPELFEQNVSSNLVSEINLNYLIWRFFTFPSTSYYYISAKEFDVMYRIGFRGNLKEVQVLFVNAKKEVNFKIFKLLIEINKIEKYDFISFPISKNNLLRNKLKNKLFIKVPNKTNMCFKILNESAIIKSDIENVSISAINYHTY
jgi:GNAT superfamily N-acetyltransferase